MPVIPVSPPKTSSLPPLGHIKAPLFEVWGARTEQGTVGEKLTIYEFKKHPSMGLNQRIVAAYNPDTQDFDPGVFLSFPSQPVPDEVHTLAYLAHAREGLMDPNKLIKALPSPVQASFVQSLNANRESLQAMHELTGVPLDQTINPERLTAFYTRYGPGEQGNAFRLVADLQVRRAPEKTIIKLLNILHGELKTSAILGFSHLNGTVREDLHVWGERIKNFVSLQFDTTSSETKAILRDRRLLGLPVPEPIVQVPPTARVDEQPRRASPPPLKREARSNRPQPTRNEQVQIGQGIAGDTDRGKVRETNQDNLWFSPDEKLFMVADGVGGHQGGERASQIVRETFEQYGQGCRNIDDLKNLITEANQRIKHEAVSSPNVFGMGSTVVAGFYDGQYLYLAHVGDSRAYLLRQGRIQQLTNDHSVAEEGYRMGLFSKQEALHHPQRNVLTRSLGAELNVNIEVNKPILIQKGDKVILCSDGLTNMVADEGIAQIVNNARNPHEAVKNLINTANQNGGKDNITVVINAK